jgi:hypothetical protein
MQLHIGDLFISKNTCCVFVIIAFHNNSTIVMMFDYISLLEEVQFQTGLMFLDWPLDYFEIRQDADKSFHLAFRHE